MPSSYNIYKSANNQYYFNLTADNNEKILASEMYPAKAGALSGIESVKVNSPNDARYSRKQSSDGKHYFVLVAMNNEPIGKSETYNTPQAMEIGIAAVKRYGPNAPTRDLS